MALFSRRVPILDAVKALRAELGQGVPSPLTPELEALARLLVPRPAVSALPPVDLEAVTQEFLDALPDPAGVLQPTGNLRRSNLLLDQFLGGRSLGRTLLEATRSDRKSVV